MMTADEIIARLALHPHPEGGYYRETFRDDATVDGTPDGRARSTAIYYLLKHGEQSAWHRINAVEIWHYYAGASLRLSLSNGRDKPEERLLGTAFDKGETPQVIIPRGIWQSAVSVGDWTLVGCTVAPGFEFSGFEMAPPDWQPGQGSTSA